MKVCDGRFEWNVLLLLVTVSTLLPSVTSFCRSGVNGYNIIRTVDIRRSGRQRFTLDSSISASSSDSDFSTFADSLDVEDDQVSNTATSTTTTIRGRSNGRSTTSLDNDDKPWQAKLEELLDPMTSGARRQILLSELLNANEKIRESVMDALTNRKVREESQRTVAV
jgi:hypothetical protein